MILLALALEIKHNVLKKTTPKALWKKLENICVKVVNQSSLFEDGVVSTQYGDGRRSP